MTIKFYTKEQIQSLALEIVELIKQRDPEFDINSVRQEAISYTNFIKDQASSCQYRQNRGRDNSYEELTELKELIQQASKKAINLSSDSTLQLSITSMLNDDHYLINDTTPENKLIAALDEFDVLLSLANLKPPSKGRPKQSEKSTFIESALQVFELSTGRTLDDLLSLPNKEQIEIKTTLYKFIELTSFDPHLFVSSEALKKYVLRYTKKRDQHKYVLEDLEEHLNTSL